MKAFFKVLLVLSVCLLAGCKTNPSSLDGSEYEQSSADDAAIPDSIKAQYYQDAARLALRHLFKSNDPETLPIEIPQNLVDSIYSGLIRVYNCTKLPGVELICRTNPVHTFPNPEMNLLIIGLDTSFAGFNAWENGNPITGINEIDVIILTYNLEISNFRKLTDHSFAILSSEDHLNLYALSSLFEHINGIRYAEPGGWGGDGPEIQANLSASFIEFTYSIGWGDCPAGCTARHYWEYTVDHHGIVHFNGEYGTPLIN